MATGTTKNDTIHFDPVDATNDGLGGTDTLLFDNATGTNADLSSITLTSIEILKAGKSDPTTFLVDQNDLAAKGSVIGSSGNDTLTIIGTSFDLRSTTLSSVEILQADKTLGIGKSATFMIDQKDLAANGSVIGATETADKLLINGASLDLTSTTLSDVEFLAAGTSKATSFILDGADLTDVTSIAGSSGTDTVTVKGALDFGTRDLDSIEVLKAGFSTDTVFTIQEADLKGNGGAIATITGSSGSDILEVVGTDFDLTSTTVTSIENLVAGTNDTVFTLDQADIAKNGSITGSVSNADALIINGPTLDLTSTDLSGVETLQAGTSKATTFTVDAADLTDVTAVIGSKGGTDSLIVKTGTTVDLGGTDLSVEILKTLATGGVSFTVDESNLAGNGGSVAQIIGAKGTDSLTVVGTDFDLSGTTLTSIEQLATDNTSTFGTVFRIDQADLAKGGSVTGSSNGDDEIVANGSSLDLTSTTLTDVENLSGGSNTLFTITGTQLADLDKIESGSGGGTLVVKGAAIDVSGLSVLDAINTLKAGLAGATTFTIDQSQLGFNGGDTVTAIVGSSGSDILQVVGTDFNLSGTTLTSVEQLVATANGTNSTVFTLDQADLAKGGSIVGSVNADDEIAANGASLDLTSTGVTGVEHLKGLDTDGTTFTLTGAQFVAFDDIDGNGTDDTLVLKTTDFNLGLGATLSSIEELRAGVAGATTFVVAKADLASGGGEVETITGSSGADTLTVNGTDFDLTGVTLSSIDKLVAQTGLGAVTFTLENTLLGTKTTIIGTTNSTDTIVAANNALDLRSTTLSSVEELKAGTTFDTTFTITSAQLGGLKISGDAGNDTLKIASNNYDLSSASLSSIEVLAGSVASTTFKLNQGDLAANGSVTGFTTGTDTIVAVDTQLDLSSTALTSIEKLQAGNTGDTTFTVNQADLANKGSVVGGKGTDSLVAADTELNLTSTTLSSIEVLAAGKNTATTFTVDQADLAKGGSVEGSTGNDTLIVLGNAIDLTSTTLTSVEALESSSSKATTFTLDADDLASLQSITGNSATTDTLIVKDSTINLGGVTVSDIEALKAGGTVDTTITLQGSGGFATITGTSKTDTLVTSTTALDLTSATLSSIEVLKAGNAGNTTFTVDQADLASKGSVIGNSGDDTLQIAGTSLDLRSTSLSSVEVLKAGTTSATTFTVDSADLASGGSVVGGSSNDTLIVADTAFDLSSTSLNSVETLKAGSAKDTTFTVNQGDLASGGSVIGSTGKDTLASADATLDLTTTTLSSVEVLQSATGGTAFKVDQDDLASKGSVVGSTSATDTLTILGTSFDVTSTTLTSVEVLKAGSASDATFKVNQDDLAASGSVVGSSGTDTLTTYSTTLDLSSTALTSVEILQAGTSQATTFTVDQDDLVAGGSVNGSTGSDTLAAAETELDLTNTTLSSIETLSSVNTDGTKFTLDAADLTAVSTIKSSVTTGSDTLIVTSTAFDLSSVALSSIEKLQAGATGATGVTTFTVDQADLASGGSVIGTTNTGDKLIISGSSLDLTNTTLTDIEALATNQTGSVGTTFTVDQADIASLGATGDISGNSDTSATDTLAVKDTSIDLTSTTLTSIEVVKAGGSDATTFKVDLDDVLNAAVVGVAGKNDTLNVKDSAIDLTSTTLSSIEILQAGATGATGQTTFTVDQADLASGGTVIGTTNTADKLVINGTSLDLTSTTLNSVESLQAGGTDATTFKVDQADLLSGGSVEGVAGKDDTLQANGTELNLSSTTLTSIEILAAGASAATTFTLDNADAAGLTSIIGTANQGSNGLDTISAAGTLLDLSSTTLTDIEKITGTGTSTKYTLSGDNIDQLAANAGAAIAGGAGTADELIFTGNANLSNVAVTGIEKFTAADSLTITIDQADIASVGTIAASNSGDDVVISAASATLDLTSVTLTDIDELATSYSAGTTWTVTGAQLAGLSSVQGDGGTGSIDTLVVSTTGFDLSSTSLDAVEVLKAGNAGATTFTVDGASDLGDVTQIIGSSGTDSLVTTTTELNLSNITLSSIEILKAGGSDGTTFTVDGGLTGDLASVTTILGHSSGTDTLAFNGSELDLTSATLTSVEILKALSAGGTTLTVDAGQLADGGSVIGVSGSDSIDTLVVKDTAIDLTSTTLTSIEHLTAGLSTDTTFTLDQSDLANMGTSGLIAGSSGSDTLVVKAAASTIDLSSTTLSSIETIETAVPSNATLFVIGNGQNGAELDLTTNGKADTVSFTSAYKLTADGITSDTTIATHILTVDNFLDGTGGDKLNISSVTNGAPTTHLDITGYISLVQPTSLKAALDIAAAANGGTTASVVSFQYLGDTYVLVDNSSDATLNANDAVIKLVGNHNLTDADNFTF